VTPGYFQAMGIPLLRGRVLDERDHAQTPLAIVINESMAQKHWPGEDPVGRRIGTNRRSPTGPTWWEVVGVVGNVRSLGLDREEPPAFYIAHAQRPARRMSVVMRTAGEPTALAGTLRSAIWALDGDLAIPSVSTMESMIAGSIADRRWTMSLLGAFAALAMLLAAIGLYGVMAYTVAQRTQEIGIRLALGAQRSDVLRLVLANGMGLWLTGVALGVAGALVATRWMGSLLYGVGAVDPVAFVVAPLLLAGVALLATVIPARRAMRTDPLVALRYE
jgi:putative ABC transport system permease protein